MTRASANGTARPAPPRQAADWNALDYQRDPPPLLACSRRGCGAKYLDDEPSRAAHIAVFGHSLRTGQPASPPKENP